MKTISNFFIKLRNAPKRTRYIFLVVVLAIVFVGIKIFHSGPSTETPTGNDARVVTLESVGALSEGSVSLPLIGTVTSVNEATIRSEASGNVTVLKRLGDYVSAGQTIAYFENSAERASVLQAEGAYEAAKAGGAIAVINRTGAGTSLSETKTQALNSITSAYTTLDDVIRTKTDASWQNPETTNPKYIVSSFDSQLVIKIEGERQKVGTVLRARETRNKTLTTESDLRAELTTIEDETKIIKTYLDDLSTALNRAIPDANVPQEMIDGFKANTAIARQSVNGVLSTITGARNALNASLSQSEVANQNAGTNGSATASVADSQIKSALGNLRGAQSRLEKTIIRSPISGTINSLSINTGDFVSPFTQVAVVSNNGALEILSYITEEDTSELHVGDTVKIGTDGLGTITRIAPAIDPLTKKIEVHIGITKGAASLVNGQTVSVEATRRAKQTSQTKEIKIPLSALKLTPVGSFVFTVSASSTLIAHPIQKGSLLGDQVVIESGLTKDMIIVTDARGLQDGMKVSAQ
jgi:RND family efflux transporter MFP subunit